jgi:lysophospholipase L1-like esterase
MSSVWRVAITRLVLIALGVFLALAGLELGMRATGQLIRYAQTQRNQRALTRDHALRIMCVGESTTAGDGENGRYPENLEEILNLQDLGTRVAVINKGRSGGVTLNIIGPLRSDLDEYEPDIVVAMMGINDVGRTHAFGTIIAPGADRWYGTFRVYKLYRLIRAGLERRFGAAVEEEPLRLGEGIVQTRANVDRERELWRSRRKLPELPPHAEQIRARLQSIRTRLESGESEGVEDELTALMDEAPGMEEIYLELASLYRGRGDLEAAHRVLLRGQAALSVPSLGITSTLVHSHDARGYPEEAIRTVRYLIDGLVEPGEFGLASHHMLVLANLYEKNGREDLAEQTLLDLVNRVNPGNEIVYQHLIDFYVRRGDEEQVARHREIQRRIRFEYVNPVTWTNYEILKKELAADDVQLFAMQYPTRPIEPLKRMVGEESGAIFIDNTFFRDLVVEGGYQRYFVDNFAGDFGHLTRLGNCLLAENAARVIVEQHFGLEFDLERSPCRDVPNKRGA